MSVRPTITPREAILSSATRRAIEAMGGLELAALVTRAGKSQLSRCQSENDDDILSLRDAEALDRATAGRGGPHILSAYARLLDHAVIPVPVAPSDHEEIKAQIMAISMELGDLSREAIEAERDGVWSEKEARRALDQADQLMTAAAAVRAMLFALAYPEDRGGRG